MFGPFFQAGLASGYSAPNLPVLGMRSSIQRQIEVELGSEGLCGQVLQFSFVI
jgi:hypothetical protein